MRIAHKHLHTNSTQLITGDVPFNFVEAYKSMRTNLEFASINNNYKKIIVTSALPGEGKSTVAINLALTLQDMGSRVLLVDCDLRMPKIHTYLKLNALKDDGLTNMLAGSQRKTVLPLNGTGLYVIVAGPIPPNPAEMIGSAKMGSLIQTMDAKFDYIIFDTPPVMVVTDAAVLSQWCDGVILVIKQRGTTRESAQAAKNRLENVGATVIGCVLNDFNAAQSGKSSAYYQYQNYSYGYGDSKKK